MIITPRISEDSDERVELDVSPEDHAKILRRQDWQARMTDLRTGRIYDVRGADCGLDCMCDAVIEREITLH